MKALLVACASLSLMSAADAATHHKALRHAVSPEAACSGIGTDDALRPLVPSLVRPASRAFGYTGMTAAEVEGITVFRCVDSEVLMCSWGANLPCGKAETSTDLPAASNWCEGNQNAGAIPAYVTGHDSIYQWSCHEGTAVPGNPAPLDPRGFFRSYWAPAQ